MCPNEFNDLYWPVSLCDTINIARDLLLLYIHQQSFIFILNLLRPHLPSQRDEVNQHLLQQGTKKSILKNLLTDKHHRDFMINLMEYEGFSHDRELKLSTLCTTWDSRTGVIGGVSSLISNQDSLLIVFIDCIEHLWKSTGHARLSEYSL